MAKKKHLFDEDSVIKVLGVGTFGCGIIQAFMMRGTQGVELVTIDTDEDWLKRIKAPRQIKLGKPLTRGLRTDGDINLGRRAAIFSRNDIQDAIKDADILFLLAGLGGGTGSAAIPVIADLAREAGVPTIVLATLPSDAWGKDFLKKANDALAAIGKKANVTIPMPVDALNSKLKGVYGEKTEITLEMLKALTCFFMYEVIIGLTELIKQLVMVYVTMPLDDLKIYIKGTAYASIGIGMSKDCFEATKMALQSLFPERNYHKFKRVIIVIKMGRNFTLRHAHATVVIVKKIFNDIEPYFSGLYGVSENENPDEFKVILIAM